MDRLKKGAVGDAAIKTFEELDTFITMWGDCGILDSIAEKIGWITGYHPLDRHKKILDYLDRDKRFKKGFVDVNVGNRTTKVRCFQYLPFKSKFYPEEG